MGLWDEEGGWGDGAHAVRPGEGGGAWIREYEGEGEGEDAKDGWEAYLRAWAAKARWILRCNKLWRLDGIGGEA